MKFHALFLVLIVCLQVTQSADCPMSHFSFTGNYTLSKQDELNKTLTKVQQQITVLQNVTYEYSPISQLTIFNAKPVFYNLKSYQKIQIVGDIIIIYGCQFQVTLSFQWVKKNIIVTSGKGVAIGRSNQIAYAKEVMIKNGRFYGYQLLDCFDVSFPNNAFQITRISPPIPSEEILLIQKLINLFFEAKSVSKTLADTMNRNFAFYLKNSLQDDDAQAAFDYKWVSDSQKGKTAIIHFSRKNILADFDKSGLQLGFDTQVANDKQWRCGDRSLPRIPLYPKTYGSAQEFVSYDFYQNTLRYAVQKKLLDSELNRENWGSKSFEFQAKGLYSVFEGIEDDFGPSERVGGECVAKEDGVRVGDNGERGESTFNASMLYDCTVSISDSEVAAFSVALTLSVEGVPKTRSLDFELRSYSSVIAFRPTEYALLREDSARAMVEECLERLFEARLFGSGWATSPPRYYPIFRTEKNYTVLYDPSQVNKAGLQIGEIQ